LVAAGRLADRLIDRALGLLRELDPGAAFLHWIDEGAAADLRFAGRARDARWALDGIEGADVVVQPEEPRWKRLLVADMDSTIIGQECIDELADYAGLKDKVARITERAMQGELDFPGALRERVRLLAGLDERELGGPIVDAIAKRDALIEVRGQLGLNREDVLAIGDGANDKLMIEEAGLGIAFRAKPALVAVADGELRHHGLDALLWVQGVRRRDWFRR